MYENRLEQRWFDYKNREDRRRVLEWLRSVDLISDSDVEKGLQPHDVRVQYQEKRRLDIKNMNAGKQVRCINVHGHPDCSGLSGLTTDIIQRMKRIHTVKSLICRHRHFIIDRTLIVPSRIANKCHFLLSGDQLGTLMVPCPP